MIRRVSPILRALPLAATLFLVSSSFAEIIPVSQERTLNAFVIVTNNTDYEFVDDKKEALDYGLFDEYLELENRIGGAFGRVQTAERSEFSRRGLQAVGSFSCEAQIEYEDEFVDAFGQTFFGFDFDVTTPERYTLRADLEGFANGDAYLSLIGPQGIIFYVRAYEGAPLNLFEYGTFEPGFYRFAVWTGGFGQAAPEFQTTAAGNFDVNLSFGRRWDRDVHLR